MRNKFEIGDYAYRPSWPSVWGIVIEKTDEEHYEINFAPQSEFKNGSSIYVIGTFTIHESEIEKVSEDEVKLYHLLK